MLPRLATFLLASLAAPFLSAEEVQFALLTTCWSGGGQACLIENLVEGQPVAILGASGTKCPGRTGVHRTVETESMGVLDETPLVGTAKCSVKAPALAVAAIGMVREYESLNLQTAADDARPPVLKRLKSKGSLQKAWEEAGNPKGVGYSIKGLEIRQLAAADIKASIVNWVQCEPSQIEITYRPTVVLTKTEELVLPGLCSSVGPAFRLNGQIYLLVQQAGCESGENVTHVFRISEDSVEQVYSNGALST